MLLRFLKILSIISILGVSVYIAAYYTPADVRIFVRDAGIYAPLIFIIICILKPILIFIPSFGLTVIAGIFFGPFYGTIYVTIGGAGSSITGYYVARWLGMDFIKRITKDNKLFHIIDDHMKTGGKKTILAMRLFNLPWDIVSYWAGATGVPFRDFYVSSIIPLIPMSFLYVYFGSNIFSPASPGFIIPLLIIILTSSIPYLRKRYRGKIK